MLISWVLLSQDLNKNNKKNEALTVSEQERIPQFKLSISKETKTMNSEAQKNNLRHKGNPRSSSSSETTTKIRKGQVTIIRVFPSRSARAVVLHACVWERGTIQKTQKKMLWTELCPHPLSLHVEIQTLSTSECECIWR